MRFVVALLVLFAGFVGYGAYRQREVAIAQRERAAAILDSLRRADSLQRQAEADAAAAAQRAAQVAPRQRYSEAERRSMAEQLVITESDAPKPLKLPKPERRVVIIDKPVPTNRPR